MRRYKNLPCLNLGNGNYTPIELCTTVVKDQNKSIDVETKSQLINLTSVESFKRRKDIDNIFRNSKINTDPILDNFAIKFEMNMMQANGRLLEAPEIKFDQQQSTIKIKETLEKGRWYLNNIRFYKPASDIKNWILINFSGNNSNKILIQNFVNNLIAKAKSHGINMSRPLAHFDFNQKDEKYSANIFRDKIKEHKKLDLIVAVLSSKSEAYRKFYLFEF